MIVKVSNFEDMAYAIASGMWSDLQNVLSRIAPLWDAKMTYGGNHPIYFIFSLSTSRQFCALAEMVGPVSTATDITGWKKPNCTG